MNKSTNAIVNTGSQRSEQGNPTPMCLSALVAITRPGLSEEEQVSGPASLHLHVFPSQRFSAATKRLLFALIQFSSLLENLNQKLLLKSSDRQHIRSSYKV